MVSELRNASGGWCLDRIRSSFMADEAVAILSVPCATSQAPNSLLWHYEQDGCYPIKCEYHVGRILNELPSNSG